MNFKMTDKVKDILTRLFQAATEKSSWVSILAVVTYIWGPELVSPEDAKIVEQVGMALASVGLYYIKSEATAKIEVARAKSAKKKQVKCRAKNCDC